MENRYLPLSKNPKKKTRCPASKHCIASIGHLGKNIYEKYYSKDPKTFLEVLDVIYEYGATTVSEALCKLEKISPFDMSSDKAALICAKKEEALKQTNIKTDRLSEKSKTTLAQYDRLRKVQNQTERKVV